MPADEPATRPLPELVFSGRSGPVVLSSADLVRLHETDDLTIRPLGTAEPPPRSSPTAFVAHGLIMMIFAVPALLVVAFAIAVAVR